MEIGRRKIHWLTNFCSINSLEQFICYKYRHNFTTFQAILDCATDFFFNTLIQMDLIVITNTPKYLIGGSIYMMRLNYTILSHHIHRISYFKFYLFNASFFCHFKFAFDAIYLWKWWMRKCRCPRDLTYLPRW